jgi:hypothetical protein
MKKYMLLPILILAMFACVAPGPQPVTTPAPASTATPLPVRAIPTTKAPECAVVTAASLHVRFEADYYSDIVGWFTRDTLLSVKNNANPDWWLVYGSGIDFMGRATRMTGYVKTEWIQLQDCDQYVQTKPEAKRR